MKNTLDILHVTFDKSPTDETVMSVAKVVNGKIYVLKMELGEQADILYRLLTEKTAKMEIKAESKEQDTISRQEVLKYFEGWKNQIKYYHPYAKNFDIPYEEAIQRIKDVPPVKCVSLENKYIKEIDHLRKYISKLETQIVEQEPCDKCVYSTSEGCQYDDITETIPPFDDCISRQAVLKGKVIHQSCDGIEIINGYAVPVEYIENLPPVTPQLKTGWIPVSEMLPELNRPLLVTAYHRVYYGHLISENGNYGYPVFRIHGLGDKNRDWVQETMSHGPYSLGRIDAWMYLDIPEPYKPQEGGDQK